MDTTLFEQLGNSSSKIFFLFDVKNGAFTYLNKAVEQLFVGDLQAMLQEPASLLEVVHPDERILLSDYYYRMLQGKATECKFRMQLPECPEKHILAEVFPVFDDKGVLTTVAGIVEDVTDRVTYMAYLKEFGRKKDSAMEILAHDLRGPISMIQSISSAMETDLQLQDYSALANYTNFIGKACKSCFSLIMDILNEEHLKAPTIPVKQERVEMVEKVKEVVDTFAMNKSISQRFTVSAASKVFASVDVVKIDQILNNLISNAIKFTPPEGTVSFNIEIEQAREKVLLKVTDNGIGIPQELQPFLFERNSRAARPGLRGERSKGIGLSIVKDLVELQGGEIWCESEEHKGTTFYIRLLSAAN